MTLVLDPPILEEEAFGPPAEHALIGLPPTLAVPAPSSPGHLVAHEGGRDERGLGMEMVLLVLLLLGAVMVGTAVAAAGIALTT